MFEQITDWRPAAPIAGELLLYVLIMPNTPVLFSALDPHQVVISLSSLPVILGSVYWFLTLNDLPETRTPEQRVDGVDDWSELPEDTE